MECINKFNKRTQRKGKTLNERLINENKQQFEKHIINSPTSQYIQVTDIDEVLITEDTKYANCFITDITLNDQNNNDEKYIHFKLDENVDVGCYINWQDCNWILVYKEHNPINTHKTFTIKKCNQVFKFLYKKEIYNIPIVVTNLTLYSDGMSDGVYTSKPDGKRNMIFGSNPITRTIALNNRIMLTNLTVFRITHIDDFSINGLITNTIYQTALVPEDDVENNIAYNKQEKENIIEDRVIQADDFVYLGCDIEINTHIEYKDDVTWSISSREDSSITVYEDGKKCIIRVTTDSRFIGQSIIVEAYNSEGIYVDTKSIQIKGYF